MSVKDADFRPAYVFDDVKDLNLENPVLKGNGVPEQIILKDVQNKKIDQHGTAYGVKTMN